MLALMCLSGCKSIPSYSSDYSSARNNITGMTLTETQALEIGTHFISTFNTLLIVFVKGPGLYRGGLVSQHYFFFPNFRYLDYSWTLWMRLRRSSQQVQHEQVNVQREQKLSKNMGACYLIYLNTTNVISSLLFMALVYV